MEYQDLDDIQQPVDGELVQAAWGYGVCNNFDALWRPYHFVATRNTGGEPLSDDSITEIYWDEVINHSGEFYDIGTENPSTFSVPASGFYFAHCKLIVSDYPTFTATTKTFVALVYSDDFEDNNYLLRQSADISVGHYLIGGIVRLRAGQTIKFVAYQNSGDDVPISASCSLTYLGGI